MLKVINSRDSLLASLLAAALTCLIVSPINAAPPVKDSPIKGTAFVLAGNTATLCNGATNTRVINNAVANGNPNAVILVTHNQGVSSGTGFVSFGPYAVFYDDADTCVDGGNHWVIINMSPGGEAITSTDRFNILIITP